MNLPTVICLSVAALYVIGAGTKPIGSEEEKWATKLAIIMLLVALVLK